MQTAKLLLLTLALAVAATANPVIAFYSTSSGTGPGGHTGSISYAGNGAAAIGSGIDIDFLAGINTNKNDGFPVACFSCVLNFTTGANTNDVSANGTDWTFAGGGFFRIWGGMDLNNNGILDPTDIQPGTLLLTGTFASASTISTPTANDFKFISSTLINTMDDGVDNFFGNGPGTVFNGVYNQTFATLRREYDTVNHRWRFTTYAPATATNPGMLDGSVINTSTVPEPVSLLLFGTTGGILAICALRRRRRA